MACSYCYAKKIYDRFKWDRTIRHDPMCWLNGVDIRKVPAGSRIFLGSTMELFGKWVKPDWMQDTFDIVHEYPELDFIFLSKLPQKLSDYNGEWSSNCIVGVSAANETMFVEGLQGLAFVAARTKFISLEPYLEPIKPRTKEQWEEMEIDWLIIGAQTKPSVIPSHKAIVDVVVPAVQAGVKVFLKDNLKILGATMGGSLRYLFTVRQEMYK